MTKEYIITELSRRQGARLHKFPLNQVGLRELQDFLEVELLSILGHSEFRVRVIPNIDTQYRLSQPNIVIEETRTITINMRK